MTIKKLADAARQTAAGNHLAAQREVRRLVATRRRLLPAAQQPDGRRCRHALATLHPTDRSRMGLSHHQGRTGDPPDLASERRPREGPHPGLLPGLRAVEDAGRLDAAAPGWATRRARCWTSWRRSKAATSCCRAHDQRRRRNDASASAASPNPTPPKPSSSTASASPSPAASAASTTSYQM